MTTWMFEDRCDENWNQMQVRKGGRHCERCNHTVVDLSTMTEREFNRLAKKHGSGKLCGRARLTEEGAPIFRRERKKRFAGGFALMTALSVVSCTPDVVPVPIAIEPVQLPIRPNSPLAKLATATRPVARRSGTTPALPIETRWGTEASPSSTSSTGQDEPSPVADCTARVHIGMGGLRRR